MNGEKQIWVYVLSSDRRTSYNDKKRPIRVKIGSRCSKPVSLAEAADLIAQTNAAIKEVQSEEVTS